jgi:hypothetical protein
VSGRPRWGRFEQGLALIAAMGALARISYVLAVSSDAPLVGDAETYHLLGRLLAGGDGYVRAREAFLDVDPPLRIPTAEFPPLHPIVLAAARLVGLGSPSASRLVVAMLGVVVVVLTGMIGRHVAGPAVGLVAAGAVAFHPGLSALDGSLLAEPLATALTTALALLTLRHAPPVWVGVVAGALVMARSEGLLIAVLLIGVATIPRRAWRSAAIALVVMAVPVVAWTVRNAVRLDHLQPFTNNSGTLLAGANCDAVYDGFQQGLWRLDCVELVDVTDTATGAPLDETDAAARRRSAAVSYALDRPVDAMTVAVVRLGRTWGTVDVRNQLAWESFEGRPVAWGWRGWWWHGALMALAVPTAVVALWRRAVPAALLVTPVVVSLVSMVGYGNQRFRAAAEPSIAIAAAVGMVWLAQRALSTRRSSPAAV